MGASSSPPTGSGPGRSERDARRLLPLLEELRLVREADAVGVLEAMAGEGAQVAADRFAERLAGEGLLTPFQAGVIARGRGEDLRVGNYVLERPIGSGGMGKVYLARHRTLRREAAVKVVDSSFAREPKVVQRFRLEVEAMARLDHPNLVAAFDAGEIRGRPYVVMEYVDGPDLGRVIRDEGPMPVSRAIDASIQVARGLEAAHNRGIVHRDVKPHNLLISKDGVVKVSDLGLARLVADVGGRADPEEDDLQLTRFGAVIGTVHFMSPEQARNSRYADERSDLYSLGCTLYTMLTGRMPYRGKEAIDVVLAHRTDPVPSSRAIRPEVPSALDALCRRMMAKEPGDRPGSMAEVIEALQSCPVEADPVVSDPLAALVLDDTTGLKQSEEDAPERGGVAWWSHPAMLGIGAASAVLALVLVLMRSVSREDDSATPSRPEASGPVTWVTSEVAEPELEAILEAAPPSMPEPPSEPIEPPPALPDPGIDLLAGGGPTGERHRFEGHRGDLRSVAVSPDGTTALTGSSDGTARLWDLKSGTLVVGLQVGPIVDAVAIAPDGRRALIGNATGQVSIVDLDRLRSLPDSTGPETPPDDALVILSGHQGAVLGVAFSADGETAISCGADGVVRLWDAVTGEPIERLQDHGDSGVWCALPSKDGRLLLTLGRDRRARVRDRSSGSAPAGPIWNPGGARAAAFGPDGTRAILGGIDGMLRLWDLASDRLRWRVDARQGRILGVAFSGDGRSILSVGARDVVLRDSATGAERHRFELEQESRAVAFLPGDDFAVTAGADGLLRLWALPEVGEAAEDEPRPIGAGRVVRVRKPIAHSILEGADSRAFNQWLDECRERSLIPVDLDAFDSIGIGLFGGIARPNVSGLQWRCEVIRGSETLVPRAQELGAVRLDLAAFDSCMDGPDRVSACLFVQRPGGPSPSWTFDVVAEDAVVASSLDARRAARQRPGAVASYVVRGTRMLTIQSVPDDGAAWTLHHDVPADRLPDVLADARRQGLRPVSAEADAVGGSIRYAILLVGGRAGVPFDLDPRVDERTWPGLLELRIAAGIRPETRSTVLIDGRESSAILWGPP